MDFIYLLIACAFFALQFIFQKLFEKRTVGGLSVCLWNQIVCCIVGAAFLLIKAGGSLLFTAVTVPALIYALLYSASGMICSVATISAMGCGQVGAVGTYCLAGGMIVPFLYGILALDEEAGLFKWLGMLVLCASLIPSVMGSSGSGSSGGKSGEKSSVRFVVYSVIVFLTNGLVSVFSKMHQISPAAMSEDGFMLLSAGIRLAAGLAIILALASFRRMRGEREAYRNAFWNIARVPMTGTLFILLFAVAGTYSVCNTLGNLFSLRCMVTMDASIQFPILSAVVIVLTALFGRIFFGEKITKGSAVSLIMSVAGIGLFMIP